MNVSPLGTSSSKLINFTVILEYIPKISSNPITMNIEPFH